MLALIMAGGKGSRLNLGEKPLVTIAGQPMIARVIRAFVTYGCEVVVVASARTPMTRNWCRSTGVELVPADGNGYVEDMVDAVLLLGEKQPLFVSVCDLPFLCADIIGTIHGAYLDSGKDACSSWIPLSLVNNRRQIQYVEQINGIEACPCGVNILRGDRIAQPQDEFRILLDDPRLAFNINTRADLHDANRSLMGNRTG